MKNKKDSLGDRMKDFYENSKYLYADGKIRFGVDGNQYIGMTNLDEKETDDINKYKSITKGTELYKIFISKYK